MKVEIIKARQRPRLSATGELVQWMEVDYMVGRHGPFTFTIPLDEYDKDTVIEKIKKEATDIKDLVSEFEV